MIVAVNAGCLNQDEPGECGDYISVVLERISKWHNEDTFILFSPEPHGGENKFPPNVIPVITGPLKKSLARWFVWYNIKIPLLLKKYKVDVFLTTDFCSLTTRVPQCLLLYDLSFLHSPSYVKKSRLSFYKRYASAFLKKSKMVIAVSQFAKTAIVKEYKLSPGKIEVAYADIPATFKPLSPADRESIKTKYADDNEYFVFDGGVSTRNNLTNLLKAFSAFKKRQKSNMQLLIIGEQTKTSYEFLNLKSYKFRNDVKILTGIAIEEEAKIMASAYGMIYTPFYENFGTSLFKAMKCEVPIITSSTGVMPEICGDAALYANPENFKEIAIKMMLLFKDEKLRRDLIEKGKMQVQKFNWDATATQVWDIIKKAADV